MKFTLSDSLAVSFGSGTRSGARLIDFIVNRTITRSCWPINNDFLKMRRSGLILFACIAIFSAPSQAREPLGLLSCDSLSCASPLFAYCVNRVERDGLLLGITESDQEQRRAIAACYKASELGLPEAQHFVAGMKMVGALRGRGGDADIKSAAELSISAAEHGHAMAQQEIGQMYFRGAPGFEKSDVKAYQWLKLYSLQSLRSEEPPELMQLRRSMKEEELREAEKMVEAWRPK
ncbi:hypothetical protein M1D55_01355 [Cupriavidus sp. JZ107]